MTNKNNASASDPGGLDPDQTNIHDASESGDLTPSQDFNTSKPQSGHWKTTDSAIDPPQAGSKSPPDPRVSESKPLPTTKLYENPVPEKLGRFLIRKLLGRGGFGEVYLAFDEQLRREVAIKLTFGSRVGPKAVKMFLKEAQMLAELEHPNIVPVYEIGTTERNDIFIVSKLIDGMDLATRIEKDRPSRELSLEIIAAIADALYYAHSKGLVHRDIKPANILLDKNDRPYLADFGIALRETDQVKEGDFSGTPAYMSPEQARGEGHRIDNRSDIYSLGVVLYELLAGRRPFKGKTTHELIKQVQTGEVRTPRTFDATITRELERVCLKALSRHPSDRFAIAKDLAEEVRWLIQNQLSSDNSNTLRTPAGAPNADRVGLDSGPQRTPSELPAAGELDSANRTGPLKVVPKGLRSFDAGDADFFLELLPGPFDRDGLPESIRFWKSRIEATDIDKTFRVGLVYGPSGCGKSSLMKAGLLPRLSTRIERVYVEATPDDTPARLLKELQKRIPDLSATNLVDALSMIRRRKLVPGGGKLLLVIDQFEQWLYAHEEYSGQDLTNALLQCDGETIQAIVMVREDFWISVSRFLRELDTPILERENSAMVDLFDLDHAKKVLSMFGRAYEKLPDERSQWSEPQKAFLAQASEGLSENRKVISVRLALFSEMMKSREWTPASIEDVGGVSGVGVTFLEETFGQKHSPIQYRQHQEAVRGLLSALLPASGTDIKGSMQSVDSLKKAAGYEDKPREFEELMEILDKNLRLITPVDDSSGSETGTERSYQLAHDYMVPSLREWLTQKQRETKKGRAELKLAERAATWGAIKENRQLPSLWEWLKFRRWTDKGKWTKSESQLMSKTIRFHGTRIVFFTSVACLMIAFAIGVNTVETWNAQRASKLESEKMYKALEAAELDFYMNPVPHELKKLSALQPWINLKLKQEIFLISDDTEEKLKLNQSLLGSSSKASEKLQQELIGKVPYNDRDRLAAIERQANAAMALLRLNELSGQSVPDDSTKRQQHYYRLYGMILGLGEYSLDQLPSAERDGLLKTLETMYAEHPSRAIHSAVGWLLRRWGQDDSVRAVEEKELAYDATGAREWYVIQVEPPKDENSQPEKSSEQEERSINLTAPIFFTMLVYPGGEFEMGDPGEQQRKSVPGPFAVSDREVTWRQFSAVDEDTRRKAWEKQFQQQIGERGLHPDEPVFGVNWFDAVYYCRWLTESKMPGERNQCYVKKDLSGSKDKMKGWLSFPSNTDGAWEWPMNPKRPGFRLLTEAEWEYVACGSIETRYSFGSSGSLLAEYGWFTDNSEKWSQRTRELRPSVAGVFDIHGNLWEWVDDWYAEGSYRMYRGGSWLSNAEYSLSGDRHQPRLTPGYRSINLGFRVALSPSGIPESPEADK